jgi:hypothetical protein
VRHGVETGLGEIEQPGETDDEPVYFACGRGLAKINSGVHCWGEPTKCMKSEYFCSIVPGND